MSDEETRPCVLCDRELEPAMDDWDTYQPHAGGEIRLVFSFGSTKFDRNMGNTVFRGLVCDECGEKIVPKMEEFTP